MGVIRGSRLINIPAGVLTVRAPRSAVAAPAGWWVVAGKTCIAAYQPKGAADLAASYINLANPGTYNAAPGVAPTFNAATGWTSNGTQWLNTGVVPAAGYTAIVRFSGFPASTGKSIFGEYTSGARFDQSPGHAAGVIFCAGGLVFSPPQMASGVLGVAGQQGYRDGIADGAAIPAWTATTALPIYLLNRSGGDNIATASIQAFVVFSSTLTPAEVLAVSTAMAAL